MYGYMHLLSSFSRKRKRELEEDDDEEEDNSLEEMMIGSIVQAAAQIAENVAPKKERKPRRERQQGKTFWLNGYGAWYADAIKNRLRVTRETFEMSLARVSPHITK